MPRGPAHDDLDVHPRPRRATDEVHGVLVVDDVPRTVVRIAHTRAARTRGLLGCDDLAGALLLSPARQVHTIGMRFALDVAWCDRAGTILRIDRLDPGRVSRLVLRSHRMIEARAGAFARWKLHPGARIAVADGW